MLDLGSLGDLGSEALALNGEGQVAGINWYPSDSASYRRPFLWSEDRCMEDLGNLGLDGPANVVGLNDLGMVIGRSRDSTGQYLPFLWTEQDGMQPLWSFDGGYGAAVEDISDLGWIVGRAYRPGDGWHAALWVVEVVLTEEVLDEVIEDVEDLVAAGILGSGQGNALTAKLKSALAAFEKGNTTAACNKIGAFVNQVEALVDSGTLSETEGAALIDAVCNLDECM